MFMEPIKVPTIAVAKAKPSLFGMVAGAAFLALSAIVMPAWLLIVAAWMATSLLIDGARGAAGLFVDTLRYAGQVTVGR